MTGNNKVWRASLAGLASVAMLATMGVVAGTANADPVSEAPTGTAKLYVVNKEGKPTEYKTDALTTGQSLADSLGGAQLLPLNDGYEADTTGTADLDRDGSKFVGWVDENDNPVDFYAPVTGDLTIKAKYVKDVVTVTFADANLYGYFPVKGESTGEFYAPENSALTAAQLPTDAADAQLTANWTVQVGDESAKTVTDLTTVNWVAPEQKTVTVTPKDTVTDVVKLTFKAQGDSRVPGFTTDGENTDDYAVDVKKGDTVKLPALATKQSGDSYTAYTKWTNPDNANQTLEAGADFTANKTIDNIVPAGETQYFFVKFDANGGSKVAGAYYTKGEFIKEPTAPTKDKSVFAGWAKQGQGVDDKYVFGESYSLVNDAFINDNGGTNAYVAPTVAYAVWDTDTSKTVKVTFKDAVYEGAQKETEVKVNNGESLTADQIPDWTRDGYVLDYWIADDTTPYTESVLTDGSKTVASLNGGQDVVLTAHWTEATTDLVEIALKYVTPDNKADFTAASWAKFEPIYKAAKKAYDTAKAQTVGQISAAKSSEIVNQLNEGWKLLQFNPAATNGNPQGKDGAVHRLFNPASGEHFYSNDADEINGLTSTQHTNANWNDEGALFYQPANASSYVSFEQAVIDAYQNDTKFVTATPGANNTTVYTLTDAGKALRDDLSSFVIAKNVTRLFNRVTGDHVWSTDAAEIAALKTDVSWSVEGDAFAVPSYNGVRDVVRLYNGGLNRHLLSVSADEQNILQGTGWTVEGVAYKAF